MEELCSHIYTLYGERVRRDFQKRGPGLGLFRLPFSIEGKTIAKYNYVERDTPLWKVLFEAVEPQSKALFTKEMKPEEILISTAVAKQGISEWGDIRVQTFD